jgi:hypothetical protein
MGVYSSGDESQPIAWIPSSEERTYELKEEHANARLIANAPVLLNAIQAADAELTAMLRLFESESLPQRARLRVADIRNDLRVATAKAIGEAP